MTNYNLPHRLRQFAAEAMYIFEGDRVLVRDAADELERLERVRNECWDAMNAFGVATGAPPNQDLIEHLRRYTSFLPPFSAALLSIPMRLTCPQCSVLHVDKGEHATKPHHTHACQHCGNVWRPAIVPTVGVRFLPGFKDARP